MDFCLFYPALNEIVKFRQHSNMIDHEQGIQAKVYKKSVLATHGIMMTKTAMFISERVLLVNICEESYSIAGPLWV
jgi:hypothetical protein